MWRAHYKNPFSDSDSISIYCTKLETVIAIGVLPICIYSHFRCIPYFVGLCQCRASISITGMPLKKKKRLEFLLIHRVEDSKRDKLTVLPRPGHQTRGTRGEQFPQHLRVGQAAWKVGVCYPHTMIRHVLLFWLSLCEENMRLMIVKIEVYKRR